jgi:hypothetical protein
MNDTGEERRRAERKPLDKDMEFILYLDAFKARSIDLSEVGIRFETDTPIIIRIQLNQDGQKVIRDARLVWAEKKESGGMTYGFEFIPDVD